MLWHDRILYDPKNPVGTEGPKGIQKALGFRRFFFTALLPIRFSTPTITSQSYVLSSGRG